MTMTSQLFGANSGTIGRNILSMRDYVPEGKLQNIYVKTPYTKYIKFLIIFGKFFRK